MTRIRSLAFVVAFSGTCGVAFMLGVAIVNAYRTDEVSATTIVPLLAFFAIAAMGWGIRLATPSRDPNTPRGW